MRLPQIGNFSSSVRNSHGKGIHEVKPIYTLLLLSLLMAQPAAAVKFLKLPHRHKVTPEKTTTEPDKTAKEPEKKATAPEKTAEAPEKPEPSAEK